MQDTRKLRIVAAVVASFTLLIVAVLFMLVQHVITYQMALLMFIGLFGLYFGFGVLIAVWRFIAKLQ